MQVPARLKRWLVIGLPLLVTACAFLFGALKTYSILGTHDVELVFRGESPLPHPDRIKRSLTWRLSAEEAYADVTATDREVRVVVDKTYAPLVIDLVEWRGGISAHRLDGNDALPPMDEHGIAFAPIEGTKHYRMRGYSTASSFETVTGITAVRVSPDGRSVDMDVTPEVVEELQKLGDPHDYVLRGGTALAIFSWELVGNVLRAHCGEDLRAYQRAYRYSGLLVSTPLPPLALESETRLPTNVELGALHIAIPLVVAATWFAIMRRFDRAQPEPWWLVLATGSIAMAIFPLAFVLRTPLTGTDWGDPHLADKAGRLEAFPATLLAYFLRAGLIEEAMKLAPILVLARWRKEFDEPIDGIVYGAAAAIGFSCLEEFGYLLHGRLHASLLVARATSTPPAHVFFAAVTGYALGTGIGKGRRAVPRVLVGYLSAAAIHGLYDSLLSFKQLVPVARVYQLALMLLFVFLVRRALRGSRSAPEPSSQAKIVRAGSWIAFAFNTLVFAVGVASLRELSALPPPEIPSRVVGLAVLAALLSIGAALVALAMVGAVPLDVVLDEAGVTFSGVTRPWSAIGSVHAGSVGEVLPWRRRLILDTSSGPLTIGPLSQTNAAVLLSEIASRIRSHRPAGALVG